jgi:hypothetical protein
VERREQELLITGLIRSLGTSLKNRGLYPASHPLVKSPLDKVFKELRLFFSDQAELALAISDETLIFEGFPIFNLTSPLESFVGKLTRIGAPAVIFRKELTPEELENFVRFLHETKAQGLPPSEIQALLEQAGIKNIRVKPMEESDKDDREVANEIYNSAVSVVSSVMRDVRMGLIPSGTEADRVTRDINSMLTRNRDAMLALTLIKELRRVYLQPFRQRGGDIARALRRPAPAVAGQDKCGCRRVAARRRQNAACPRPDTKAEHAHGRGVRRDQEAPTGRLRPAREDVGYPSRLRLPGP